MTLKELFKKVATYNEIAALMQTDKACIYFGERIGAYTDAEHFKDYEGFRKHIRKTYIKELADAVIKSDGWEIDGELQFSAPNGREIHFFAELSAN